MRTQLFGNKMTRRAANMCILSLSLRARNIHAQGAWTTSVCHQPIFLFSRRHVRTGRGTMMFIWKRSNNRREAKYNTCLLLAARLFNAYYTLSRLLLPSFIALAKKIGSSFPQFFCRIFFPAILVSKPSDRNKVTFTFPLEFDLIRFDVWVNAELNY